MPTGPEILSQLPLTGVVARAVAGARAYLIGGAVRDAVMGETPTDLDFIVDDAPAVAERMADLARGRSIVLHEDLPTARVVTRVGGERFYVDFAERRAATLRDDLAQRDFTINAMAVGPIGGRARLHDPCGGREDLRRRLVRMTSLRTLTDDPCRVVRAYRFAAKLGFEIEGDTRRECRRLAGRLTDIAAERTSAELLAMLAGQHYPDALRWMLDDGALAVLIPEFSELAGVDQGGIHEFDVGEHSVLTAQRLARVMADAPRIFPDHAEQIGAYLGDPEHRAGLVLGALLHDLGKPECRVPGEGRWRFFGHESRGAELTAEAVRKLRIPKRIRRQVELLVGSHMRLLPFMGTDTPTERGRKRFVRQTRPHHIGLVLLALADRASLRAEPLLGDEDEVHQRVSRIFDAEREMVADREAALPIGGDDLIALGLAPGPLFAAILEAVEEEWVEGRLRNKAEALAWVREQWG